MEGFSAKIAQLESTMSLYGREVLIAFATIVFGLILIKWINKGLKRIGSKLPISPAKGATVRNVLCVLLFAAIVTFAAIELGISARPVIRFLAILTLAAIGFSHLIFDFFAFDDFSLERNQNRIPFFV